MRTVVEGTFGVEAHLSSGPLRSQCIQRSVLGEYLQGGIGELPLAQLVRVVIDNEQADAASIAD